MIIASKEFDHGPGPPYEPRMKRHYLKKADQPNCVGQIYYITIDETSQTWISNEKAEEIRLEWEMDHET